MKLMMVLNDKLASIEPMPLGLNHGMNWMRRIR